MSDQQKIFEKAVALIDAANSEDPNQVTADGKQWPKELLYSHRMSDMLQRFSPDADHAVQLAIRAQHVQRWKSPRDAYPMDRIGYLQWRKDLYKIQAETAAGLLAQAGFGEEVIGRVRNAVAKKQIRENPDTRTHSCWRMSRTWCFSNITYWHLSRSILSTMKTSGWILFARPGTRCRSRRSSLRSRGRLRCRSRWCH